MVQMGEKGGLNPPPVPDKIISLRKDLHSLVISFPRSYLKDSSLVYHSRQDIIESRMWLGNTLDSLNRMSPYVASKMRRRFRDPNTFSEDADAGSFLFEDTPKPKGKAEFCDLYRKMLSQNQEKTKELYNEFTTTFFYNTWGTTYMEQAVICLVRSRNYLGLELGSLRDKRKNEG